MTVIVPCEGCDVLGVKTWNLYRKPLFLYRFLGLPPNTSHTSQSRTGTLFSEEGEP